MYANNLQSITPLGLKDPATMEPIAIQSCSSNSCVQPSAVLVAGRTLCLEHYFEWCYQQLEELEYRIKQRSVGSSEELALRALAEECSNRTLAVSLQYSPLTNQDRSRLLDILLWSGDLLYLLRSPRASLPESANYISKRGTRSLLVERGQRK